MIRTLVLLRNGRLPGFSAQEILSRAGIISPGPQWKSHGDVWGLGNDRFLRPHAVQGFAKDLGIDNIDTVIPPGILEELCARYSTYQYYEGPDSAALRDPSIQTDLENRINAETAYFNRDALMFDGRFFPRVNEETLMGTLPDQDLEIGPDAEEGEADADLYNEDDENGGTEGDLASSLTSDQFHGLVDSAHAAKIPLGKFRNAFLAELDSPACGLVEGIHFTVLRYDRSKPRYGLSEYGIRYVTNLVTGGEAGPGPDADQEEAGVQEVDPTPSSAQVEAEVARNRALLARDDEYEANKARQILGEAIRKANEKSAKSFKERIVKDWSRVPLNEQDREILELMLNDVPDDEGMESSILGQIEAMEEEENADARKAESLGADEFCDMIGTLANKAAEGLKAVNKALSRVDGPKAQARLTDPTVPGTDRVSLRALQGSLTTLRGYSWSMILKEVDRLEKEAGCLPSFGWNRDLNTSDRFILQTMVPTLTEQFIQLNAPSQSVVAATTTESGVVKAKVADVADGVQTVSPSPNNDNSGDLSTLRMIAMINASAPNGGKAALCEGTHYTIRLTPDSDRMVHLTPDGQAKFDLFRKLYDLA